MDKKKSTLRVVELRYDARGKQYIALQGQSDEEAKKMYREDREAKDRAAARILNERFG